MVNYVGTISFHDKYVNPIKDKIKTSTIRKNCNFRVGETIKLQNVAKSSEGFVLYNEDFGFAVIKSIERIRFDEIDNNIAFTEGYLHPDLLKDDLIGFYPELDIEDSNLYYYIQFELV